MLIFNIKRRVETRRFIVIQVGLLEFQISPVQSFADV